MTASAPILTPAAVLRMRMRALGLTPADGDAAAPAHDRSGAKCSGAERALAVVQGLGALQGQDWRASQWAIGVRDPAVTAADVRAALDAGLIVRSWPMRGTVHLVPAADIAWMQQVTNARVLAGAPKRREFLGLSDRTLERLTEVSLAALAGGVSLDREALAAVWTAAGIEWQPSWRYHVIWWLCQNGLTTFGPVGTAGGEPRLVLAAEWISGARELTGDAALHEFALRYVRGRGAISQRDLAWWANLPAATAKRALALGRDSGALVEVQRGDAAGSAISGIAGALWTTPELLESAHADPATNAQAVWHALPAFDEHLLGYTDRAPQFDAAHLGQLVPGNNGVFQATAVRDGRAVGTWKRDARSGKVTAQPFPGETLEAHALFTQITRWAEFNGFDVPEIVMS